MKLEKQIKVTLDRAEVEKIAAQYIPPGYVLESIVGRIIEPGLIITAARVGD